MILEGQLNQEAPSWAPHPGTCASVAGCAGRWPCPLAGSGQTQSWSPPRGVQCLAEWSAPGPGGQLLGAQAEEGTQSHQIGKSHPPAAKPAQADKHAPRACMHADTQSHAATAQPGCEKRSMEGGRGPSSPQEGRHLLVSPTWTAVHCAPGTGPGPRAQLCPSELTAVQAVGFHIPKAAVRPRLGPGLQGVVPRSRAAWHRLCSLGRVCTAPGPGLQGPYPGRWSS